MVVDRKVDTRPMSLRAFSSCSRKCFLELAKVDYSQRFALEAARTECARLSVCLSGWLAGCLACWLAGWLSVCLAGWLACWLACWLAGLSVCLSVCLSVAVGQDTRTNIPTMSIMQSPPGCVSGIAIVYLTCWRSCALLHVGCIAKH